MTSDRPIPPDRAMESDGAMDFAERRLIERIVAGELDERAPEARALLDASPAAREELSHMRELEALLAREGGEQRATLAQLRPVAGEDELARAFRAHAAANEPRSQPRTAPRASRAWWFAAAAAVIASAWVGWRLLPRENPPDRGGALGPTPSGPSALTPHGAVARYDEFRWSLPLPPNGSFELTLFDANGLALRSVSGLREPRWKPDDAFERSLPARIEWSVLVLDGTGAPSGQGVPRCAAWRL